MSNVKTFIDLGKVMANIPKFTESLAEAAHSVVDKVFIDAENYAKENAKWIDRTGDARRGLQKVDLSDKDRILFYLTTQMPYGVWLELANQGKYQILRPTMTVYEPKLIKALNNLGSKK